MSRHHLKKALDACSQNPAAFGGQENGQ